MVIELNGSRLEPEHLKRKGKVGEIYKWDIPEELPPFRFVYNDNQVFLSRKKEIKRLKKEIKVLKSSYSEIIKKENSVKKSFKKKDLKYFSIGRGTSITQGPERKKNERDKKIRDIEDRIELISKMSLRQYLDYSRKKEEKEDADNNDECSLSTLSEEIEERLNKLKEITKQNKNIKYNLKINF